MEWREKCIVVLYTTYWYTPYRIIKTYGSVYTFLYYSEFITHAQSAFKYHMKFKKNHSLHVYCVVLIALFYELSRLSRENTSRLNF